MAVLAVSSCLTNWSYSGYKTIKGSPVCIISLMIPGDPKSIMASEHKMYAHSSFSYLEVHQKEVQIRLK